MTPRQWFQFYEVMSEAAGRPISWRRHLAAVKPRQSSSVISFSPYLSCDSKLFSQGWNCIASRQNGFTESHIHDMIREVKRGRNFDQRDGFGGGTETMSQKHLDLHAQSPLLKSNPRQRQLMAFIAKSAPTWHLRRFISWTEAVSSKRARLSRATVGCFGALGL